MEAKAQAVVYFRGLSFTSITVRKYYIYVPHKCKFMMHEDISYKINFDVQQFENN